METDRRKTKLTSTFQGIRLRHLRRCWWSRQSSCSDQPRPWRQEGRKCASYLLPILPRVPVFVLLTIKSLSPENWKIYDKKWMREGGVSEMSDRKLNLDSIESVPSKRVKYWQDRDWTQSKNSLPSHHLTKRRLQKDILNIFWKNIIFSIHLCFSFQSVYIFSVVVRETRK